MTGVCWAGGLSFKRPACDIFIAGITQFLPTIYCEAVLFSKRWCDAGFLEAKTEIPDKFAGLIFRRYRYIFYGGFVLNAPLLPIYPLLIQYTSLPLGIVNALLHFNLCISWSMQAVSLHHICKALNNNNKISMEKKKKL